MGTPAPTPDDENTDVDRQYVLVVCLGAMVCLAPLALYLFRLAQVTRRDHPTVVSGSWDFVGLVAGLSGFILFGGGLLLSLLQSNMRYWMRGNFEAFRAAWGQDKVSWIIIAAVYLLVVIGIVGLTLVGRRRSLVVYNVEPDAFEAVVAEVFEHLGKPVERRGDIWSHGEPLFALDSFSRGRTVTLRWLSSDEVLFREADRLLREALQSVFTRPNPTTRWLMAIAGGLGFWSVFCFGLFMVYVVSMVGR